MAKKQTVTSSLIALAIARILIGFVFLWAFIDKTFGLGFATPAAKAWLNGGSPTLGFLKTVEGPFQSFFSSLAGQPWVDWLFMLGLLGIGVALILGIGTRIAMVTGSILLFMMWLASLPLKTNPFIDDHIVYIMVLIAVGLSQTQPLSLQRQFASLPIVKKNPWLL